MRKLVLALGLLFGFIAQSYAAVVINNCGAWNTNSSASTVVISSTVTSPADIPAGAIIVITAYDGSTSGAPGGGVVDSASNTYTNITSQLVNNAAANGFLTIYYSTTGNAVALTGAGTITYTRGAASRGTLSCNYITGGASSSPLDATVTAKNFGTAGTLTVTSGSAGTSGTGYIGVLANTNNNAFTQDTGNGWSSTGGPAASTNSTNFRSVGGNQVGSGAKTFAPTVASANGLWAMAIVGFKPPSASGGGSLSLTGVGK